MKILQPETVQLVPVTVTLNDVAVEPDVVELAVALGGERPTVWAAPTVAGDVWGVLVTTPASGLYTVYARVASSPETPVIVCGTYAVP